MIRDRLRPTVAAALLVGMLVLCAVTYGLVKGHEWAVVGLAPLGAAAWWDDHRPRPAPVPPPRWPS